MAIFKTLVLIIVLSGQNDVTQTTYCTGFFISKNGHILTSAHSFREERIGKINRIYVRYGKELYDCKIIRTDFRNNSYVYDLTVLQVKTLPINLHYAELTDIVEGKDKIGFAGFLKCDPVPINGGIERKAVFLETLIESYADPRKYASEKEPEKHGFILPNEVESGFSGSPLFAMKDLKVFAVMSANTITNKSKAHYIGPFIEYLKKFK